MSLWIKFLSVTIQVKATEQYFPVVLFIMLCKAVLSLESVDEIPKCDHSIESCRAVLSCGAVYYAVQGGSNIESVDKTLKVTIQLKAFEYFFHLVLFL